jgi:hypothetical protein
MLWEMGQGIWDMIFPAKQLKKAVPMSHRPEES